MEAHPSIPVDAVSDDQLHALVDGHLGDAQRRAIEARLALDPRAAATGEALLFLHADTHLPADTPRLVACTLNDHRVIGGNFRLRFVPRGPLSALFSGFYNARSCLLIFYGDSAIFIRRDAFLELGGYRLPRIMEDIDLVRRMRRYGRLVTIPAYVESSARRFPTGLAGIKAVTMWCMLHLLLFAGAKQETLDRLYPPIR